MVVSAKTSLRMIVTSSNVLHSWVITPSGVKCDDVPSHLNGTSILCNKKEFSIVNAVRFMELIMPLRVHSDT